MNASDAARAAEALARAWTEHRQIDDLPAGARPTNEDDAYAIQFELHRRLNRPISGWKLGYSSAVALAKIGFATPPAGRLYTHTVKTSPAAFGPKELHAPKVECEFAWVLARDLPRKDKPYTPAEALAAVEALHLAIEVADSRYRGAPPNGVVGSTADNTGTGGFVLGPAVADWRNVDLRRVPVRLLVNGRLASDSFPPEERCDPALVLAQAATNLARRGVPLRAGHIVSTGSQSVPIAVALGNDAVGEFEGLGRVEVRLNG